MNIEPAPTDTDTTPSIQSTPSIESETPAPFSITPYDLDQPDLFPDILELCLDILTPTTLAALWLDHTNYIARHQTETDSDHWGNLDMIQQDADLIHAHLSYAHFKADPAAAQHFLDQAAITHIPF